jgi:hypothetical protein
MNLAEVDQRLGIPHTNGSGGLSRMENREWTGPISSGAPEREWTTVQADDSIKQGGADSSPHDKAAAAAPAEPPREAQCKTF